jgi:hypothetical protein
MSSAGVNSVVGRPSKAAKFFLKPLYRSAYFLVIAFLFAFLVLAGVFLLWEHSHEHGPHWAFLAMVVAGGGSYLRRAISQHDEVQEQLLIENRDVSEGSALDIALTVARNSLLEGLFYTYSALLLILFFTNQHFSSHR